MTCPPQRKCLPVALFSLFYISFCSSSSPSLPPALWQIASPLHLRPTPSWVLTCIHTLNVCQILPVFSLPLLLSFLLSVCPSLKQTAVTATWSSPRCGTSPRGWTSSRLRPSSPGRSFSLSIEASRMYVCLWASQLPESWFRKDLLSIIVIFPSSLEQECPSGMVDEETFKTIYSQFFPQGGQRVSQSWIFCFSLSFSSVTFQHYLKSRIKKPFCPFFVVGYR